jgi:hypothetical protein
MKNISRAGATLVLAISAGGALAAPAGSFGINVDLTSSATPLGTPANFLLEGRYVVAKDTALLAGIGIQMNDTGAATNNKYTNIGFMGGFRKYLKTEDFSPFVGGKLQYLSTRQAGNDVTDFVLMAEAGAEYFFGKYFSLEGSVGGGYASQESKPVGGALSTKAKGLGTATFNVSANFYF